MEDKNTISKFQKDADKVVLSFAERQNIKNHIVFSPYLFHSTFWTYKRLVGVVVVLLLIITGGGTSFAAASSLPGDALYPVKVNINEEVQNIIATSPDAKIKLAADQVKERLNEAEQLSAKGDLTPDKQNIIKQNIRRHTSRLKANVSIVASDKQQNQVDETNKVIDDLKVTLDQHEITLEDKGSVATSTRINETKLSEIISSVIETKAEVENIQQSLDDSNATSTATTTSKEGEVKGDATSTISTEEINSDATSTSSTTANIELYKKTPISIK